MVHLCTRSVTLSAETFILLHLGHGLASNSPARGVRNMEIYGNTWTATGAGNWANLELRGGSVMVRYFLLLGICLTVGLLRYSAIKQ